MRARIFLVVLVTSFFASCKTIPEPRSSDDVSVGQVISAVRKATNAAKEKIDADPPLKGLPLSGVAVTLQTKVTNSASLGFDLVVVSAKGQFDRSATQAMTLKLTPTKPELGILATELEIYDEVLAAIRAAARAAAEARTAAGSDFALKTVTASIGFDVTYSGTAGLKLHVGTVTIGPSVSAGVTGSQKIELTFGQ